MNYSNKTRRGGFASGVEKGRYQKAAKSRAGNNKGAKERERREEARIVEVEEDKKKRSGRAEERRSGCRDQKKRRQNRAPSHL
jgi:hypothetical protein